MRALVVVAAVTFLAVPASALQDKGGKGKPAPAPAALKPEELESKVAEVLDSFRDVRSYTSDNPRVQSLIRLGRPVIGPILRYLRKLHQADDVHSFAVKAGSDALAGVVTPEDVPQVAALLEDGMTRAAGALRNLKKDVVRAALLAPLAKGWCSYELVEALERFQADPEARKAMLAFLEKYGRNGDHTTGEVAEWLGQAGVTEALPALKKVLDAGEGNMGGRWQVAVAVVVLRDKAGIPALLDIFSAEGDRHRSYERHNAGEALNRVLGERVYVGSFEPGESNGNFEEASVRFASWWDKAKDRIRYDEKAGRWVWN